MNNRDQNSHGGTGNDQASHQGRDAGKDQGISWRQKRHPSFIPETPKSTSQRFSGQASTAAHPAIPPQSAAAPEKARQIRDAVSSSHRSEPQTPPSRSGQPRNNESREIPQRRQQPRQSNVAVAERPRPVPPRHYEEVREERHGGRIAVIAGIAVLAVLLLSYIAGLAIYHGKFLPKTYVNGVDIGGMNVEDAQNAVLGTAQDMGLTFIPKSGDPITFKGSSFGCTVTLPDNALAAPADESHAAWFKKLFSKTEYTVKVQDSLFRGRTGQPDCCLRLGQCAAYGRKGCPERRRLFHHPAGR
ncbi:hypothetical protein [Ruminococcus sp.]|uniref:hypothetical protein n=1 Tax=Ruminococcus sp. TaxID=41978 RepID=UPI003992EC35